MKIDNPQQYVGRKYGHTTIIKYIGKYRNGYCLFGCKCDCGREFRAKMREKNIIRTTCYICNTSTIFIDYYDKKYTMTYLAKKLDLCLETLKYRIKNWDMSRWAEPVKRKK